MNNKVITFGEIMLRLATPDYLRFYQSFIRTPGLKQIVNKMSIISNKVILHQELHQQYLKEKFPQLLVLPFSNLETQTITPNSR